MMHLEKYPQRIRKEIESFAPVAPSWAHAARMTLLDVRQEIALAALAGLNPLKAVPASLKIRKIKGVWRSEDAVCMASELEEEGKEESLQEGQAVPVQDADGIDDLMQRHGIGRRAAQLRVKNQLLAMKTQGDLFVGFVGEV